MDRFPSWYRSLLGTLLGTHHFIYFVMQQPIYIVEMLQKMSTHSHSISQLFLIESKTKISVLNGFQFQNIKSKF